MPFDRATGIGSTLDCADHSKSVCFFDSTIISSPVIVFVSVSVAMSDPGFRVFVFSWPTHLLLQHFLSLRPEFIPRLPLRELVRLRHPVPDGEEHAQIFARAAEVPLGRDDVLRLVIA